MSVTFICMHCGRKHRVEDGPADPEERCEECPKTVHIPRPDPIGQESDEVRLGLSASLETGSREQEKGQDIRARQNIYCHRCGHRFKAGQAFCSLCGSWR